MKILQVISSFPPAYSYGGALNVAYHLSKELVRIGHDVTVYTTDVYSSNSRLQYTKNPVGMEGIIIYHFRNISNILARKNLTCALPMYFSLKKNTREFDLIHLHEYRSFQAVFVHRFAKKYKIPVVIQPHGSLPRIIERKGLKQLYDKIWGNDILKNACKIIAVSQNEVEQFREAGIPDEKIAIIPNGVSIVSPMDLPPSGQFREQFDIHEKYMILFVGRIHRRKGIDFLIRAFHHFIQTWNGNDVALIIAGPDDGYRSELISLVEELDLSHKVKFVDYLSSVGTAYLDADVLVYPSIYEIFGLVPFEALLHDTPVIVTDDCGCGELIREADCGYLVRYGDVAGLSEMIGYVLKHPEENAKKVQAGKKYIRERLAWERIVSQVENVYQDAISA